MSFAAVNAVFRGVREGRIRARRRDQHVLLWLAERANGKAPPWDAWPSVTTIARETGWSESAVRRSLQTLEELWDTECTYRSPGGSASKTSRYRLLSAPVPRTPDPCQADTPTPVRLTPTPVRLTPEPGSNQEGNQEERARTHTKATRIPPDFALTDEMRQQAIDLELDPDYQLGLFVDHYLGDGGVRKDWHGNIWTKWLENALKLKGFDR